MTSVIAEPRLAGHRDPAHRWSDLTTGARRFVVAGTTVDTTLKIAMLVDLRRRPAAQVRGPKWAWASTILVNSAGVIPLVYFAVGRTPEGAPQSCR